MKRLTANRIHIAWMCLIGGGLLVGCQPPPSPPFTLSEAAQKLPAEMREKVHQFLREQSGTPEHMKLIGHSEAKAERLVLGHKVYARRCVQCHGVNGDGNGPSANSLFPRPRDYRKGVFKFTSTPYGIKPTRGDLVETIRRGISGTSMPSFHLLPDAEVQSVVDYVIALSQRGEVEGQLAVDFESEDEFDSDLAAESVDLVKTRWSDANAQVYVPKTSQPVFTAEHIAAGKAAFLSKGCSKCHGEDGRGLTPENLRGDRLDVWGHPIRAADLSSGMLRGGPQPLQVYRRIYGGINGTPMPAFERAFAEEPDTIWNLVAYVLSVSDRRRAGDLPPAGDITPYAMSTVSKPATTE